MRVAGDRTLALYRGGFLVVRAAVRGDHRGRRDAAGRRRSRGCCARPRSSRSGCARIRCICGTGRCASSSRPRRARRVPPLRGAARRLGRARGDLVPVRRATIPVAVRSAAPRRAAGPRSRTSPCSRSSRSCSSRPSPRPSRSRRPSLADLAELGTPAEEPTLTSDTTTARRPLRRLHGVRVRDLAAPSTRASSTSRSAGDAQLGCADRADRSCDRGRVHHSPESARLADALAGARCATTRTPASRS